MNTATSMELDDHAVEKYNLDRMRLQVLLQQGPTAILTNVVISLITAVVLYPALSPSLIFVWASLSVLVSGLRWLLLCRLKLKVASQPAADDLRFYENLYASGLLISGVVWGLLGWGFSSSLPMTQQIYIPLVVGGMSAGALFSHLGSVRSFYSFVVPMILPVTAGIYISGMPWEALTTLVYLTAIMILVKNLNRRFLETLALRQENIGLIQHLTEVNKTQANLLQRLQDKEKFLLHTFEEAGVPMLLVSPQFQILNVNRAACRLFEYPKKELLKHKATALLHEEEPHEIGAYFRQMLDGKLDQYTTTNRFVNSHGQPLWLTSTLSAVRNDNGDMDYVVMQSQDITQQQILSHNLQYQTWHDAVTGLPNRIALENRLHELLSEQGKQMHVLGYIDLDQFKVVNDTCGHIVGDTLLKEVGGLLRADLPQSDMLTRFSGDEFAVLMNETSMDEAATRIENLLNALRAFTFNYGDNSFKVSASVGLVSVGADSTLTELLKQADSACNVAKEAGRDRFHIYSEDDVSLIQRTGEMQWVLRIQQALAEQRLTLFSQPIIPVSKQARMLNPPHQELLIRMLDADGNVILPAEFLPAAERYNLAAAIDLWTVNEALSRLQSAKQEGKVIEGVYGINLSGQSLGDARFYEQIIRLINEHDLTGTGAVLCFEITETAAITNMTAALKFIGELRKTGCLFALDDFGSGLSSFAYLKQLPVDFLKIDGMFVKDCVSNTINLEIVNAINGIGQVLGLNTIAEFVEDEITQSQLEQLGVDFVQGFATGQPEPWSL